jgi:hypothetical protein
VEHVQEHPRFVKATGIAVFAAGLFAAWVGWDIGGQASVLYGDDLFCAGGGLRL